jgi:soluble lytic murein transglycosylase-like protein
MTDANQPDRREDRRERRESVNVARRAEDRGEAAAEPRRGSAGSRTVFQRFRQPIIGLGLAGMALPLVRATQQPGDQGVSPEGGATEGAADPLASSAPGQDVEEALTEQIALTVEEQEREDQVVGAVEEYGIERDLAEDIYDIAREENIEPRLAFGLVKTESMFKERAVSHVGARGLTQVMPRTAAWMVPGTKTEDLYDRQTNLRLGFRYLDQMIDKYKGNVRLALLAYNRGPGTVDKVLKRGGNPDNGYADKVLRG